jgi:hypothetical protein
MPREVYMCMQAFQKRQYMQGYNRYLTMPKPSPVHASLTQAPMPLSVCRYAMISHRTVWFVCPLISTRKNEEN